MGFGNSFKCPAVYQSHCLYQLGDLITTVGCTFFQTHVSQTLIQQCTACCLKCNSVCSAPLSSRKNPSVSNYCSRSCVGAGVRCIPCPPPLISDRLFSISSLHQLEPLTDNLLPKGVGSAGMQDKERWGCVGGLPCLSKTTLQTSTCSYSSVLASCVCVSLTGMLIFYVLHLPSLQCFYFERTKECSMIYLSQSCQLIPLSPSFLSLVHTP